MKGNTHVFFGCTKYWNYLAFKVLNEYKNFEDLASLRPLCRHHLKVYSFPLDKKFPFDNLSSMNLSKFQNSSPLSTFTKDNFVASAKLNSFYWNIKLLVLQHKHSFRPQLFCCAAFFVNRWVQQWNIMNHNFFASFSGHQSTKSQSSIEKCWKCT